MDNQDNSQKDETIETKFEQQSFDGQNPVVKQYQQEQQQKREQSDPNIVDKSDTVLLIDNRAQRYIVELKKSKMIKWRKKKINIRAIIGQPYDTLFEVDSWNEVKKIDRAQLIEESDEENEDEEQGSKKIHIEQNDNRNLVDDNNAQSLTHDQIKELQKSGMSGLDIVDAITKNSSTFESKTQFSKEKFIKKKLKKYVFQFSVNKITIEEYARTMYVESPFKLNFMRNDALSLFLQRANIYPKANILLMDDTKGLMLGAVTLRLQGQGKITLIQQQKNLKQNLCYTQLNIPLEMNRSIKFSSLDEVAKGNEKFTHLLVTGYTQVLEILETINHNLLSGCYFVCFNQFMEPLNECYKFLLENKKYLFVQVNDIFTREHQVLPNRTHPLVTMDAFSGYILSAIKTG